MWVRRILVVAVTLSATEADHDKGNEIRLAYDLHCINKMIISKIAAINWPLNMSTTKSTTNSRGYSPHTAWWKTIKPSCPTIASLSLGNVVGNGTLQSRITGELRIILQILESCINHEQPQEEGTVLEDGTYRASGYMSIRCWPCLEIQITSWWTKYLCACNWGPHCELFPIWLQMGWVDNLESLLQVMCRWNQTKI